MKDWIVETRVTSRRTYHVQAENERDAIFASTTVPPDNDCEEFEETISIIENTSTKSPDADRGANG